MCCVKLPGLGAEAVTGNRLRDDFLCCGRQCCEQPPHLCGSLDSAWGTLVPLFCLSRCFPSDLRLSFYIEYLFLFCHGTE